MQDRETGNLIVYNGEIYNFRDLRRELEIAGHQFRSQSDTEVILAAYRAWGEDCFGRLRGMFALGLWDQGRKRLLLARDGMGIKPLYYYGSETVFLFSSEVRTLLRTGLVLRNLDREGLFSYLTFGAVSEPSTIIEGVRAVPRGSVLVFEHGTVRISKYWDPIEAASRPSTSKDSPRDHLPEIVRDAVLSHMVSDVPVGVFLSGGIDSSSLVAVLSQGGHRASTFSLVFDEHEFNEARYSREVARRFATDHHEIPVSEDDVLACLPQALGAMDQPTIDGINTYVVSAKARAAGVKVALTGLGADEMFAGYSTFRRVPKLERTAARLGQLPSVVRRPLASGLALFSQENDQNRKLIELAAGSSHHPYFSARMLFTGAERATLFDDDSRAAECALESAVLQLAAQGESLDPVNRVSYLESDAYMKNMLLRDADFMSMAHGLELRVPFLDRQLVEACFRIPGKEKLEGRLPKNLLLQSLGAELPAQVVNRPKRGFTFPWERWLRNQMMPMVESAMVNGAPPMIRRDGARKIWQRFLACKTSWSRPWSLFVLKRWCDANL